MAAQDLSLVQCPNCECNPCLAEAKGCLEGFLHYRKCPGTFPDVRRDDSTSRWAALVVVMPQMTHSCLSRGAESDPASEAEYSGVAVPEAESSAHLSLPALPFSSGSAQHSTIFHYLVNNGRIDPRDAQQRLRDRKRPNELVPNP